MEKWYLLKYSRNEGRRDKGEWCVYGGKFKYDIL
jgi:hypothetical protein